MGKGTSIWIVPWQTMLRQGIQGISVSCCAQPHQFDFADVKAIMECQA
ncbi:MAG: hypothetical protein ACLUVV_03650 [Christensenellales bacterium]